LLHAPQKHANEECLKGLINVVPIGGWVQIREVLCRSVCNSNIYCKLLEERQ